MKKNLILSVCSAGLLVLCFPNFNLSFLIWFALVPFFFLIDGKSLKAAFLWGWLTGFLFFLGTHFWLIHVTLPGMILVNIYLGIYFGLFGLGYSFFQNVALKHKLWLLPSLWVALEFLRDRLFTGFGWACLGHSQYKILPLIQIADITGVFGVSFLIVIVNVFLKDLIEKKKVARVHTYFIGLLIAVVLGYGYWKLPQYISKKESSIRIAIVQPNIPQTLKWDPDSWPVTQEKILHLTKIALVQKPDLVIWPEASFPGFIWQSPERYQAIKDFVARHKVPLLLGTITQPRAGRYYNTAILLSQKAEEIAHYDKRHLVPFGEFLPFRPLLGWIGRFAPIGEDFSVGQRLTVFPQGFAALICFEDTVAPIVRQLVKQNPSFLVNITNDGWFKDTNEPYLHLQGSVFQAVANRRSIIRAANTGVSATISPAGVTDLLDIDGKAVMVEGIFIAHVQENRLRSFYTQYGDVFAYFCFFIVAAALIKRRFSL